MKVCLSILLISISSFCIAQPQIKFDTTNYDYGMVPEGPELIKELQFTNIGNEPLTIYGGSDGGVGTMNYSKEPILPGKKGRITYTLSTMGRPGNFFKTLYIRSNAKGDPAVNFKGRVLYIPTKIAVKDTILDIGKLNFGNIDTVEFEITNVGKVPLNLRLETNNPAYDLDLLITTIRRPNGNEDCRNEEFAPNEQVILRIIVKNIFGNTGRFGRNILLKYNSLDSINLLIEGEFVGNPYNNIVYDGLNIYYYSHSKLVKSILNDYTGEVLFERTYEGSYMSHYKQYSQYPYQNRRLFAEGYYKNGILTEYKWYKE